MPRCHRAKDGNLCLLSRNDMGQHASTLHHSRPQLSRKNVLPFRMALHLRFRKRAQGDDDNPLKSRILHRPESQLFTDLLAAQSGGNEGMVYDDATLAGTTVGHLGFVLADRNPIPPLRWAIFPLDIDLSFLGLVFHANCSVAFDLAGE